MKIYLDDADPIQHPSRKTPEGYTRMRTVEQVIEAIKTGTVEAIHLDNDLGSGYTEGYEVMRWLEEQVLTNAIPDEHVPRHMYFHTDNTVAKPKMKAAARNIKSHLMGWTKE